jgi:hypothetical protein
MPRSQKALLDKTKKQLTKKITEQVVEDLKTALDKTANELCKDMSEIFDKCIDKFYEYETRKYYRHETGRGTGTGMNLYRANQFKLNYGSDGHVKSIHMGWNANDMAPYKSWKDREGNYHPVGADYVLRNVMNGIRGLEDDYIENGFASYNNHWTVNNLKTKRNYFGELSGTPNEIFKNVEKQWKTVRKKVFDKYTGILKGR